MAAGIEERHRKGKRPCRSLMGGRCNCEPTYRASVWSPRERKLIRRTFRNRDEARTWHEDAVVAVRVGQLRSPSALTVDEAAKAWLAGAREGSVRNRSGDRYKPSTLRGYRESLKLRVLPAIGARRLSEVARADVQDLVDQLLAKGCGSSTVRNTLDPLRAIYRRALARDQVAINPTVGLELPASRGRRDRIASPDEAVLLLAALSDRDRPL